jgi:hypothetical protein
VEAIEGLTHLLARVGKLPYSKGNPILKPMLMDDAPTKTEFLERIRTSREKLDRVVGLIDPLFMTAPGVCGDWSVKDILAHITWQENISKSKVVN